MRLVYAILVITKLLYCEVEIKQTYIIYFNNFDNNNNSIIFNFHFWAPPFGEKIKELFCLKNVSNLAHEFL